MEVSFSVVSKDIPQGGSYKETDFSVVLRKDGLRIPKLELKQHVSCVW